MLNHYLYLKYNHLQKEREQRVYGEWRRRQRNDYV